jgi:predicted dehydrogenase
VSQPVRIGVIGCGIISEGYLRNLTQFADLEVVACGDLDTARAESRAAQFGVGRSGPPEVVLEDESIEVVVNLTTPAAHAEVTMAAISAGKSVWTEKPLALDVESGRALLREAAGNGVLVGCAPDTWLGGGLQTARALFDRGAIGEPVAGAAFLLNRGAEQRRPDPEFYYRKGVGPMYDMGPYYLSTLVSFLGPVCRVSGSTRMTFPEREVVVGPNAGHRFPVEVMTHVSCLIEFAAGLTAVMTMSCDVWATNLPRLEIYGTEGSMSLPDPNRFDGPTHIWTSSERSWSEVPARGPYRGESSGGYPRFGYRGLGVAELAAALRAGREPRANGQLALHVLDVIEAVHRSAASGEHIVLTTTCEQPTLLDETDEFVVLPGSAQREATG